MQVKVKVMGKAGAGAEAPGNALRRLSRAVARVELAAAALALGGVLALLLLNIVTRLAGRALFWVDEAAVMAMVWMAFLAASVGLEQRANIAVTLMAERLGPVARRGLGLAVDALLLGFTVILLVLTWRWFAPWQLAAAGGDLAVFAERTLNFMYEEPTQTLGWRKAWFWAILPVFSVCASIHCLANLADSARAMLRGGD